MGRYVTDVLAKDELVSEVTIATRSLAAGKSVAKRIGRKANAVAIDAMDERKLAAHAAGYDLIVSTAGPDFVVQVHAVRAAIDAGVSYCDIAADRAMAERSLVLDQAAKDVGVTVVIGIGSVPGLSNLMMKYAASKLDKAHEVRFCIFWPLLQWAGGDPGEIASKMRRTGKVDASWQTVIKWAGRARQYRNGRLRDVDSFSSGLELEIPIGGKVMAHPIDSIEAVTLPRHLKGIKNVSMLASLYPPPLNELYHQQGRLVAEGRRTPSESTISFLEAVANDPKRWLRARKGLPTHIFMWAEATGQKRRRNTSFICWPAWDWISTTGPLSITALKLLKNEVKKKGVLPPEACFEPMPFFKETAAFRNKKRAKGVLLGESSQVME